MPLCSVEALHSYKEDGIALSVALERQGLPVPDSEYFPALSYAAEQIKGMNAGQNGREKHNLRSGNIQSEEIYDYSKSFAEQVEDWKTGKIPKDDTLLVCETPEVFQKIGLGALPMTIDQTHMNYALSGAKEGHFMGESIVKELPDLLKNPVAIIEIESETQGDTSVVAIVKKDVNGQQVMAAVKIGGIGMLNGERFDVNFITTAQPRSNAVTKLLTDAIKKENTVHHGIFFIDRSEARSLYARAGVQFPGAALQDDLMHSIFDAGSAVKGEYLEQTKTRQFRRWFGNSVVKNADGSPKVMYHGTQAQFWAFDKKKAKSSGLYGRGFYFTDSPSHAGQYGNTMEVYLRIENPLQPGDHRISKKQLVKFLEAVAEDEDMGLENYGYGATPQSVANEIFDGRGDFAYLQDINASAIGDFRAAIDLFNKVNGTKYDGIITPTESVVYEPTQIKSATDNRGTFDPKNPDIRFNLRATDQSQQMAEGVREDAELYAQVQTDEDARAALQLIHQLYRATTEGGADAALQKGAWQKRLPEIAQTGTDRTKRKPRLSAAFRYFLIRRIMPGRPGIFLPIIRASATRPASSRLPHIPAPGRGDR